MEVVLVMFRPDGTRRSFPLTKDTTILGRREDCDFRIPLAEVSRKHCKLIKDSQFVRLEDLGSANGTLVNGQRADVIVLKPGDLLGVGSVQFVVRIDGLPSEADIALPGPKLASDSPPTTPQKNRTEKNDDPLDIDSILSGDDPADSGFEKLGLDDSTADNR